MSNEHLTIHQTEQGEPTKELSQNIDNIILKIQNKSLMSMNYRVLNQ